MTWNQGRPLAEAGAKDPWADIRPVRKEYEKLRVRNTLWIVLLAGFVVFCFHRAISGTDANFSSRHLLALTPSTLESRVLLDRTGRPWVVTLWVPWCPVCREFAGEYKSAARDFGPDVSFGQLDLGDYPEVGARYSVSSIPTVLLFRNGRLVDRGPGAMTRDEMGAWLDTHLSR